MTRDSVLIALTALGLSACSLGSTPPENFYTLSAQISEDAAGNAASALSGKRIDVVLAHIDELVDRPQWVMRIAPNQVTILEQQRWGEALKTQIPQVLVEDLRRHLPHARFNTAATNLAADAKVILDVQKFEAWSDRVELTIAWRIVDAKRRVLNEAQTSVVLPVLIAAGETKYAAVARTQSQGLSRVSVEIAGALRQIALPPAPGLL